MQYKDAARMEIRLWETEYLRPPGLLERTSRKLSRKVNTKLPAKVHSVLTGTVKGIVQTAMAGVKFAPKDKVLYGISLYDRDTKARQAINKYKKIAAAEGAGTGAGGIMLGMVDFPALIAIKMKCLFELAHIYGRDTRDAGERLFTLHVFRLAFSDRAHREELWATIQRWDQAKPNLSSFDWEKFQQEYRDSIDFRKMMQMVPGIGAVVGAWANYGLLTELGDTAIQCYRVRLLADEDIT